MFKITEEEIKEKVKEIARRIEEDFKGEKVLFIGILKGSFKFLADLVREIKDVDIEIDFFGVSSYGKSTETTGVLRITKDLNADILGKNVVIVEDIVDTGYTLKYIYDLVKRKGAKEVKICVLLDKEARREVEIKVDYIGFKVPDKFLVGYGLDYAEKYRNLPYIRELTEGEI